MDSSAEHRLQAQCVARAFPYPLYGSNIGKKHLTGAGLALGMWGFNPCGATLGELFGTHLTLFTKN